MKNLAGGVIYVGWRAIAKRLGVRNIRTAKSLVERNCLPVYRIGKSPRLDEDIYILWVSKFIQVTGERASQSGPRPPRTSLENAEGN